MVDRQGHPPSGPLERQTGVQPVLRPWQDDVLALHHCRSVYSNDPRCQITPATIWGRTSYILSLALRPFSSQLADQDGGSARI